MENEIDIDVPSTDIDQKSANVRTQDVTNEQSAIAKVPVEKEQGKQTSRYGRTIKPPLYLKDFVK